MNKFRFSILLSLLGIIILFLATFPKYQYVDWIGWIMIGSASTLYLDFFMNYLQEGKL